YPQAGFRAVYKFTMPETRLPLIVKVAHTEMECFYGDTDGVDVEMQVSMDIMNEIAAGRMTFQKAFMSGDMKMKGDFKVLRTLDLLFVFTTQKA
ncbi:MAG: SCP2 sterol-binding domain-containing protein, partial [Lachnospiraceae bacterium]|nr:SCP2 sterol-binding domain-containing protein [Lachnospiraceae bacterium]